MSAFAQRPGVPADWPLVYAATARSMRSSPYYRDLDGATYSALITRLVRDRLEHPLWSLLVEHPADLPDEIAGFVLARPGITPAIMMVYVKEPYRRFGVARRLLEAVGARRGGEIAAVLGSPARFGLARDKGLRVRLSPYLL